MDGTCMLPVYVEYDGICKGANQVGPHDYTIMGSTNNTANKCKAECDDNITTCTAYQWTSTSSSEECIIYTETSLEAQTTATADKKCYILTAATWSWFILDTESQGKRK